MTPQRGTTTKVAVVMPVGAGRVENVRCALDALHAQTRRPELVVLVADGTEALVEVMRHGGAHARDKEWAAIVGIGKHEPGMEQPRNVGVRKIRRCKDGASFTHVWFVDSDVVTEPCALEALVDLRAPGVVAAPYDWLPPGMRPDTSGWDPRSVRNDPRWEMFKTARAKQFRNDLSAGLACFSGNLLWPIDEFQRIGGYWSELHHGRCEDGELGLRAVAMDVPISFCAKARGYHLWHPVNLDLVFQRNARDVPMLNLRHPWVEQGAVFLVDRDGAAFDVRCRCGEQVPTNAWWAHAAACAATGMALNVPERPAVA